MDHGVAALGMCAFYVTEFFSRVRTVVCNHHQHNTCNRSCVAVLLGEDCLFEENRVTIPQNSTRNIKSRCSLGHDLESVTWCGDLRPQAALLAGAGSYRPVGGQHECGESSTWTEAARRACLRGGLPQCGQVCDYQPAAGAAPCRLSSQAGCDAQLALAAPWWCT